MGKKAKESKEAQEKKLAKQKMEEEIRELGLRNRRGKEFVQRNRMGDEDFARFKASKKERYDIQV